MSNDGSMVSYALRLVWVATMMHGVWAHKDGEHERLASSVATQYSISDASGPGRTFDGIGGISGGGATSVLLWPYPEPQRSEILDFLFLPNFGASLQILKVEIGGDAQSTNGVESSHMHDPWNENYDRGYEWWMMREAKKRNPNIKLYGLCWQFPKWVTCKPGTLDVDCASETIYGYPQQVVTYITKWVTGAKTTHNLTIDYLGGWNERPYNDSFYLMLRASLDEAGMHSTQIVAPDGSWDIAHDILNSNSVAQAIGVIGAHYPRTVSAHSALRTGKPLWASEDTSTYNNDVGAGCWARILNQNYVNGNITATINWNLIASNPKGTGWYRAGLMSAMHPWAGSYGSWHADGTWTAGPMIWASAHTTQFTTAGEWSYLMHRDGGAQFLVHGGSLATLKHFGTGDVTLVIEKMSAPRSACVRGGVSYDTQPENATIRLQGNLSSITQLHLWYSHWAFNAGDQTVEFEYRGVVPVEDGEFQLTLLVDSLYTLTTLSTGNKGTPAQIPAHPELFPAAFFEALDDCRISGEGPYFSDQNGVFECVESGDPTHGIVMQQMVPVQPLTFSDEDIRPHSILGHRDTVNMSFSADACITAETGSVLMGVRVDSLCNSRGMLWSVDTTGVWNLTSWIVNVSTSPPIVTGTCPQLVLVGEWNRYRLDVNGSLFNVWMNGFPVIVDLNVSALAFPVVNGHAMIGTTQYGHFTQYDNFELYSAFLEFDEQRVAQPGDPVCVVNCNSEVGPQNYSQWIYTAAPNATTSPSLIRVRAQPNLCLAADDLDSSDGARVGISGSSTTPSWPLVLQPCNESSPLQQWAWAYNGIAPDWERTSYLFLPPSQMCINVPYLPYDLDVPFYPDATIGLQMTAEPCNGLVQQKFWYDYDAAEFGNEQYATCVGICPPAM